MILGAIGQVGVDGGVGYVVEYAGEAVRALSMEQRMTICNMSIEWGARAGMIAPDDTTFAYLEGRPLRAGGRGVGARPSPTGGRSPPIRTRVYDAHVVVDVAELAPQVTWGTNPGMVVPVAGTVPDPATSPIPTTARGRARARVHGAPPGPADRGDPRRPRLHRLVHELPDRGSPRRGRRSFAGRTVDPRRDGAGRARLGAVRRQAEAEGLDRVFLDAGFEWRARRLLDVPRR